MNMAFCFALNGVWTWIRLDVLEFCLHFIFVVLVLFVSMQMRLENKHTH